MKISLASDHRGIHIKSRIAQTLSANGHEVFDEGAETEDSSDYPEYASVVARKVSKGEADRGILICGTGIGMAITANKFDRVRAAACHDEVMAEISRRHNDTNVLCLGGDLIGDRNVDDMVQLWLQTKFEDGGRHSRRVEKILTIERDLK